MVTLAHFSNGYYGAVSYVMNKEILNKIYEISKVSNNTFTLPKIEKTLYIADHYFGSLFKNYHLGTSILLPNNLFLSSSLHNEKDKDHIIMQSNIWLIISDMFCNDETNVLKAAKSIKF